MRALSRVCLALIMALGLVLVYPPTSAQARPDAGQVMTTYDKLRVLAAGQRRNDKQRRNSSQSTKPATNSSPTSASGPQPTYLRKDEYDKQLAAYQARVAAVMAYNGALAKSWDACVTGGGTGVCGQYLGQNQALPGRPDIAVAGDPKNPSAPAARPAIPPEVIAYQAVAELKLTAPKPVIGPSPELNKWKTAVVGYPLWLSVDGTANPPAVSDSVYDVSVSLQARLAKVVFDLGDGTKVTCTQFNHPWTPSVQPGAKSPWCGHTYQSVPKGSATYTVTANAYWSVDWQINGATGTLPFYQSSSVQIPVSELQVLTR